MEVKRGYKRTQVGIIPDEWECIAIADVARLESGHTPSKRQPSYWGGQIPWVSLHDTELLDDAEIDETTQTITEEGLNNSSARLLPKGTVVFSRTATVGKATVLGRPMATSQDFANYVCGPRLHNHFLVYLFRSMDRTWQSMMAGSTHNTIYMPVFKSLKIVLPPIEEQHLIAGALSDTDCLLSDFEKQIGKKRDIKQAVMQQLLTGQTRLPGFRGKWRIMQLGDCLFERPDYGINAPAVPYSDRLPSYLRITDISEHGRFCPDPLVSVNAEKTSKYFLHDGEIVFARTGASVGKSYLYKPQDGELVFAGFLIRVRPNPKELIPSFLAAYTTTRPYWNWVRLMSMRTGQPGINGNEYGQMLLSLPDVSEQIAIAEVLTDMDAEIDALEQQREKIRNLKQAMVQELLTGKTRLI